VTIAVVSLDSDAAALGIEPLLEQELRNLASIIRPPKSAATRPGTDPGVALAELLDRIEHFHDHVPKLSKALSAKLQTLREALAEQFGTAAEFGNPPGGIYLWVKLPDNVDTVKLGQAALAAGVSINPGPEWSVDKDYAKCRLRLCFANPEPETIKQGVAALAEVCRREFGVPLRSANVEKRA